MAESARNGSGRLTGKAAIVTGGASGIGRATARRFLVEGARVLVADVDRDRALETCAGFGDRAIAAAIDVRDPAAVAATVAQAVDLFGTVDILHSNAGVPEAVKPLDEITDEEWQLIVDVNLKGFFLLARAVVPVMRAHGGGCILVTASMAARRPRPGMAAYVASKSGAVGLARALAIEVASDRIRVNVINPGPARTPMFNEFKFAPSEQEAWRRVGETLPLGRAIEPEEIAAAAVYLASDEAASITGLELNVDGGRDI
jgi:3-oxoacyl-[acyl-carrier protein] reductase